MISPLLSGNPADIRQLAQDYVEAKWGMRLGTATSPIVKCLVESLAEAYLAGALDHARALCSAAQLMERK